jgi:hypothetical protein
MIAACETRIVIAWACGLSPIGAATARTTLATISLHMLLPYCIEAKLIIAVWVTRIDAFGGIKNIIVPPTVN